MLNNYSRLYLHCLDLGCCCFLGSGLEFVQNTGTAGIVENVQHEEVGEVEEGFVRYSFDSHTCFDYTRGHNHNAADMVPWVVRVVVAH